MTKQARGATTLECLAPLGKNGFKTSIFKIDAITKIFLEKNNVIFVEEDK
jgi:hypothetical protein